jgi:hypothetical protein
MTRIRKEPREAKKHPIVYTGDCPESTPEALKEFAHLAADISEDLLFFQKAVQPLESV